MRCCTKAQWEIRNLIRGIVNDVNDLSSVYGKYLGATCDVYGTCLEGKESCGKIKKIGWSYSMNGSKLLLLKEQIVLVKKLNQIY